MIYMENIKLKILISKIIQDILDTRTSSKTRVKKKSFYGRSCGIEHIFEGKEKIITGNIKFTLKGCGWVGRKTSKYKNCYWDLYHKKSPQSAHLS